MFRILTTKAQLHHCLSRSILSLTVIICQLREAPPPVVKWAWFSTFSRHAPSISELRIMPIIHVWQERECSQPHIGSLIA